MNNTTTAPNKLAHKNRTKLVYNTASIAEHQVQSINLIEAIQVAAKEDKHIMILIGNNDNKGVFQTDDEILIESSKFFALIALKGLSLGVKVKSHLDKVSFERDQEAQTVSVIFNK